MSDDENTRAEKSTYWKFVEDTARRADEMPAWMKGGTSEREQCDRKSSHAPVSQREAHKK